jgi:hypothetical protein
MWNEDVRVKYNIILSSRGYSSGILVLEFCTLSNDVDDDKEYIFEIDTLRNK